MTNKNNVDTEVKCNVTNLEGKFILVKVGSESRPATDTDINEVQEKLTKLFDDNKVECICFVTHHAISIEIM